MSRIVIQDDFTFQQTLFESLVAKNATDGASSPIRPYLIQHHINITAASTAAAGAKNHDVTRAVLVKKANNYRQLRDNKFDPAFSNTKKEVQFLKSLYGNNYSELGTWGVPVDANGKINYPSSFSDRKDVFFAFYSKHNSYPAGESPLQPYLDAQHIDIAADAAAVQESVGCDTSFITTTRQAENETQLRDLVWQPIMKNVRGIADFLKNLYSSNDRQLGLWGFTVDNSAGKPRVRTTKLKLGEQKTITSVVLGTTLENTGPVDILVHKGRQVNGSPVIVKPNGKMGILKGWSAITVENASTLETAVFRVTVNN